MNKHARASVTDHIRPHRGDVELFRDQKNHQSLCKRHHDEKTQVQDTPHLYPPGLEPASCELIMVIGPPGAGKTTYVEQHARASDQIIDLDVIAAEIAGLPIYHATRQHKDAALIERNHRLRELAHMPRTQRVWFVVSAPGKRRRWWEDRLHPARVVPLCVPLSECMRRIRKDRRRAGFEADHIEGARYWWSQAHGGRGGEK